MRGLNIHKASGSMTLTTEVNKRSRGKGYNTHLDTGYTYYIDADVSAQLVSCQ